MDFLTAGLGALLCLWSDVEELSLYLLGHGISYTETQHQPFVGFQWDLVVEGFIFSWKSVPERSYLCFLPFPVISSFLFLMEW